MVPRLASFFFPYVFSHIDVRTYIRYAAQVYEALHGTIRMKDMVFKEGRETIVCTVTNSDEVIVQYYMPFFDMAVKFELTFYVKSLHLLTYARIQCHVVQVDESLHGTIRTKGLALKEGRETRSTLQQTAAKCLLSTTCLFSIWL